MPVTCIQRLGPFRWIPLVLLASCSSPKDFLLHEKHRLRYALEDSELLGLQYYISRDVLAHLELEDSWDRFGVGLEGGVGVRLGAKSIALDIEMLFEYGYFTGGYSIMDTRIGGGLMFQF